MLSLVRLLERNGEWEGYSLTLEKGLRFWHHVIFKDEGEIRLTGVHLGLRPVREGDDYQARING